MITRQMSDHEERNNETAIILVASLLVFARALNNNFLCEEPHEERSEAKSLVASRFRSRFEQ